MRVRDDHCVRKHVVENRGVAAEVAFRLRLLARIQQALASPDLPDVGRIVVDERSIEDLCERGEALGYRRRPPGKYVYVI